MEPETVEHVMFRCVKAQLVWKLGPMRWEWILDFKDTFKEWWRSKGAGGQKNRMLERLEIFAYIFWQLRKARNDSIFEKQEKSVNWIVNVTTSEWMEYKKGQEKA